MVTRHSTANLLAVTIILACASSATAQGGYFAAGPILGRGPIANISGDYPRMFYYNLGGTGFTGYNPYAGLAEQQAFLPSQDYIATEPNQPSANPAFSDIPRKSEAIEAEIEKDGRVFIKWEGEPGLVKSITFSLLDKDKKTLKTTIVNRLPAETRLTMTNKTAYYRVQIDYVNGTTTKVTSPL